jgi:hypothetical protein
MNVTKIIPDESTLGDVQVRFSSRLYPTADERSFGPYSMANPTSVRINGRQVSVKVEGARNADWRVGTIRFEGTAGSKR